MEVFVCKVRCQYCDYISVLMFFIKLCYIYFMKSCSRCGRSDNLFVYSRYKNPRGTIVFYYYCRPCNAERMAKYYKTSSGKLSGKKSRLKYESKNPDRRPAWRAAGLIPHEPCTVCGILPSQRHHPDPKNKMSITHLCPYHHKQADLKLKLA